MAVVSSGEIKLIADVNLEINGNTTDTDVSLTTLSTDASLTAPHGLQEFYGYTSSVAPSVTTNNATSVSTTAMTANGNVTSDGGASITERGFYFGTNSAAATNNTKYTVSGTTGSFSRAFTGLSSNTTYYFWAYATNASGTTIGSRITQTTAYPYSFGNSYHFHTDDTASGSAYGQYKDINGSWQGIWSIGQIGSFTQGCYNKEIGGRQNRVNQSGGTPSTGDLMWIYKASNQGCSSRSFSGVSGATSQDSTKLEARNFTSATIYFNAS